MEKKTYPNQQNVSDDGYDVSDDDDQFSGVLLSVPLDEKNHVIGTSAQLDTTKSWSLSRSIRALPSKTSIAVEVDVYNLGLDIGFAIVEVVLWYRKDEGPATWVSAR